jgi:mRNA-degrading endonuclease RelE of RelBE toxin-antitoxin system
MSYTVLLHPDVDAFLSEELDEKSERICRENLNYLTENPYPDGAGATRNGSRSVENNVIGSMSGGRGLPFTAS